MRLWRSPLNRFRMEQQQMVLHWTRMADPRRHRPTDRILTSYTMSTLT